MPVREGPPSPGRRGLLLLLLFLGSFLTVRGYHCLDGDQAYRFPVLLHQQDPGLYRDDPFVRSFDGFNPHRGAFLLIGLAGRSFGLAAGLAVLFLATFATASHGLGRLARSVWPEAGPAVGPAAFGLVLCALAGNVGTNHLFEPIVLDRQMAFALGWVALAAWVEDPGRALRGSAWPLGIAAVIHPTVGLQLAALLGGGWVVWFLLSRSRVRELALGLLWLGLAVAPGLWLNMGQSGSVAEGLPTETFRRLSLELQGPQHMLPHLWRWTQWLAWFCYPVLAGLALAATRFDHASRTWPATRVRLLVLVGVNLAGLALAWYGVEVLGHLRLTLFQPFRTATVLRGLCLVVLSGRLAQLWQRGGAVDRTRAALMPLGLAGDGMLAAVTLLEAVHSVGDTLASAGRRARPVRWAAWGLYGLALVYLSRHDTESGHVPLLAATLVGLGAFSWPRLRNLAWTPARQARLAALAWVVPLAALGANVWPEPASARPGGLRETLLRRCRFLEVPADDVERLAVWCRGHTPPNARFVGPPGPKTFRLWSRRSLAFNRAASPYNAAGLGDWAERFRQHVGFAGPPEAFVRAYLDGRHRLEGGYDRMTGAELASLAERQGADHVVARRTDPRIGPLQLLHREGDWGVYGRAEVAKGARTIR